MVTIYGAEQTSDQIGLWMELVRGHTLEQILDKRKVVSIAEAVAIGLELCRAISAVHGAGLLHRDIKTHNVMRAEDGRIVLMASALAESLRTMHHIDPQQFLAHAFTWTGRRAEAEKLATAHRGYPFREAIIYAGLGDKDRAFEALERMVVTEPNRVPPLLTFPEMAGLRGDARFAALRQRLGLP